MNIDIIEKEGYEADDVLGTLSKFGEKNGLDVTILSGDRDTFQLATNKVAIRIPRTKAGKTETEEYNRDKIIENYGIEPKQLIEVKGLQGDTSDNIPGVPGIGEKTALSLIQKFGSIDNLYKMLENGTSDLKGKQKENLENNRDLAFLSKTLGTINLEVPIEDSLEDLKVEEWNKKEVLDIFKELKFNRYIERFNLQNEETEIKQLQDIFKVEELNIQDNKKINIILNKCLEDEKLIYHIEKLPEIGSQKIIKKEIKSISIYTKENIVYYIKIDNTQQFINVFKKIFENSKICKIGYHLSEDYVILKELGITMQNLKYDAKIAAYLLNPTTKYNIDSIINQYLQLDVQEFISKENTQNAKDQINLFDSVDQDKNSSNKLENTFYCYCISKLEEETCKELTKINGINLFNNIEMPLVEVLADMQFNGMYVEKEELKQFGNKLKSDLEILKKDIYNLCGETFNVNSTQQLSVILFEKLKLPVYKKTKTGYSTDVDILEKLKNEHPVIEKILEYRSLMKLNSTYIEGLLPYINLKTNRIHSYFHQTVTATGRISSSDPNLQNIPTRIELGKTLRKVFKPAEGNIFIDADYSQIELRVLAHISKDEHMIQAFNNDEDIHKQAASKVLGIPMEEVTKEQRSSAKAVNFGIVYGISDFGLAEQLGISKKQAKIYIEQYLEKYSGIKKFMEEIVESAKQNGYVETLFSRRRYIPELSSNNYMVRQFGSRVAMNTPIQGTAADIMKIAMINVYKELKKSKINAKIILQVHDELIIECKKEDKDIVKTILQNCMENATKLLVPLKVEVSEAENWYEAK